MSPRTCVNTLWLQTENLACLPSRLSYTLKKVGGVEVDHTDETRQKFMAALTRMLGLTNAVRNELITKLVRESFKDMHLDE